MSDLFEGCDFDDYDFEGAAVVDWLGIITVAGRDFRLGMTSDKKFFVCESPDETFVAPVDYIVKIAKEKPVSEGCSWN